MAIMKKGKAVGEDGQPLEVVAAAGEIALGQFLKVMQMAFGA